VSALSTHPLAGQLLRDSGLRTQAFIDGEFVPALSGQTFECISPLTGEVIAEVSACNADDVDRAVRGARMAFSDGRWSRVGPRERRRVLLRLAELLEGSSGELALLETLDMGKPITSSTTVDVPAAIACLAYYAEAVDKVVDEVIPSDPSEVVMAVREPLGVVAAVVPWNYPLVTAIWKVAPALAAGNSVVLKPAEQSPLSALRLGELAMQAGIPAGVLQVVPGPGPVTGRAIGLHPDIDMVAFTGSSAVGKAFLRYAGESNMKRLALECGGKSPHIVMSDCSDLETAAAAVASGIYTNQGELCFAGSRLLVHEAIAPEFVDRVAAIGREIRPGDPLDTSTRMGALVDHQHLDRVLGYIRQGDEDGASLYLGGRRVREDTGGYFVEPTILTDVHNSMTVAQEEIFGPVLSVITFQDLDTALQIANDTVYGLAAAIWTDNVNIAHRASRALRAGIVWVNCFSKGDNATPFGGFKQSGFGRDRSLHALRQYTDIKSIWIHLQAGGLDP
jgi:acyl-CoA reductase-like NAD-dependent aldehyde dehydrogenase